MDRKLYQRRRSLGASLKPRNPQIPSIDENVELNSSFQRSSSTTDSKVMFTLDEDESDAHDKLVEDNLAAIRKVLRNSSVQSFVNRLASAGNSSKQKTGLLNVPARRQDNSGGGEDLFENNDYVVSPGYMTPEPPEDDDDEDDDDDSLVNKQIQYRFQEIDSMNRKYKIMS